MYNMMKQTFYAALAVLTLGTLSACSEKDDHSDDEENSQYVNFTVGGGTTRTVRDANNKYQINWAEGDKVRVYSDKASTASNANSADYTVNKDAEKANVGKLAYNADGLMWNEDYQLHKFYAVYPADDSKVKGVDMANGTVTLTAPTSQTVTVTSKEAVEVSGATGTRYHYTCAPVMDNAYMVASCEAYNGNKVPLEFKPIMTTLDVTIANTSGNNDESIAITGFSVIDENTSGSDDFQYSIEKGQILGAGGTKFTMTTFVSFKDENGDYFLDMSNGEQVKFTVFLPPVPINANRKLKLRVHCAGANPKVVEIGGNKVGESTLAFAAGSLGNVKLNVQKSTDGDNWITPLDSNIYVQQLSIPGTNEAPSYLISSNTDDNKHQRLTIDEQLKIGIRAFDIPVAQESGSSYRLFASGGLLNTNNLDSKYTFRRLLEGYSGMFNGLIKFLEDNPGEFLILNITPHDWLIKDYYDQFDDCIEYLLKKNNSNLKKDMLVQWRSNLTIGECRGKIVVITRYGSSDDASKLGDYPGRLTSEYLTPSTWPTTVNDVLSVTIQSAASDHGSSSLYYFAKNSDGNYTSDPDTRLSYITTVLKKAKQNAANFPWSICYVAGSTDGDDDGVLINAQNMGKRFFQKINAQTEFGPLGIVFLDFVGNRTEKGIKTSDTYTTYGDLLPQAIIDNNYRFTMNRKQ